MDKTGNIVLAGQFTGSSTFGSSNLTGSNSVNPFVALLSKLGAFQWATAPAGTMGGVFSDVVLDSNGNALLAGSTGSNLYLAKVSNTGKLLSSEKHGSSGAAVATAVALDPKGNPIVGGEFKGSLIFGSSSLASKGNHDLFLWKAGKGVP